MHIYAYVCININLPVLSLKPYRNTIIKKASKLVELLCSPIVSMNDIIVDFR